MKKKAKQDCDESVFIMTRINKYNTTNITKTTIFEENGNVPALVGFLIFPSKQ